MEMEDGLPVESAAAVANWEQKHNAANAICHIQRFTRNSFEEVISPYSVSLKLRNYCEINLSK